MKTIMTVLILWLFTGIFQLQAQHEVTINEIMAEMSQGVKPGLQVIISDIDVKDVESAWKKQLKKHKAKVSRNKKTNETFGDNALLKDMSANTADFYTKSKQSKEGTEFSVFIDLGGAFVSSARHPEEYNHARKFLIGFANSVINDHLAADLKEQDKLLKSLEKKLKTLGKDKTKHLKEIEDSKTRIAAREADIIKNEQSQEALLQEITKQKGIIDSLKRKSRGF